MNYDAIAEYILKNYSGKVVEVGVGCNLRVAKILARKLDVVVTDFKYNKTIESESVEYGIDYIVDDITSPNLEIYKGSTLIYSIRPPIEIQKNIVAVALLVKSDCIIRPLRGEEPELGKLVNYRKEFFYLVKSEKNLMFFNSC